MYHAYLKRILDVIGSLMLLALSLPVLLLGVALAYVDSKGRPFFLQKRIGLNGKEFTIYKLRTLPDRIHNGKPIHVKPNCPHLSLIGRFLRNSSLDELPQLLNILKGDMSLIGPRPHALEYAKHYASIHPLYHERYRVRPGLACIVEVTALHHLTEQEKHIKLRVNCDLYYVNHQSFLMDARICIKLVKHVLRSLVASMRHAYPQILHRIRSKEIRKISLPLTDQSQTLATVSIHSQNGRS